MKRPRLVRALVLAGAVVVGLSIAEIAVRIFAPQVFEVHPAGMYVADADCGYVLAPGFEGVVERAEFRTPIRVGPSGLRLPEPRRSGPDTIRVLCLGDSLTFGFGVLEDETFASRLEVLLADRHPNRDIQVLNGGVPGYGTADALAWLRTRGAALEPDVVILQFLSVNDFFENRWPATVWADVQDGMLISKIDYEEARDRTLWLKTEEWVKSHSHLASLVSQRVGYLVMRAGGAGAMGALLGEDFTPEDASKTGDLLVELVETSRDLGARTLIMFSTAQAQVIADRYEPLRSLEVVESAAGIANAPWIDLVEHLRLRDDRFDLYYPQDGHWTAAGHRAVAEILDRHIAELGLLSGEPDS